MMHTLRDNRLLLALSGVLEALIAIIYLAMQATDGPVVFHSWGGAVSFLGKLALAGGACTISAGLLRPASRKSWLLVLNGLALGALGAIQYGLVRYRISFAAVAFLVILMAVSAGILEWTRDRLLRMAGITSIGFAVVFVALAFRWIRMEPGSHTDLFWLGAWFAFSAICMLGLALRPAENGSPA